MHRNSSTIRYLCLHSSFFTESHFQFLGRRCKRYYPVEVLTSETRGKGSGFSSLMSSLSSFINTYLIPIGLGNLARKFYFVWLIWNAIYIGIVYFTFPETKGRTLEELKEVFNASNPVKRSIAKRTVYVPKGTT
ncbi:hypothetical protein BZG36_05558 [Bifiguratus adelaidae]|uniref:Major facilitator superfamily (MFS) profile domain-containing protein n=1 Tax=Bifiguratus adelaidae TaxID=1938954 RepID=A0A261XSV7_9FUNG|nr:hypothetical protein BZG36_05558 [Bifiguratus adelaidae]